VLRTEKRRCGGAGQLNSPGNGKLWEQMSGISSRTVRFGVFEVDLDRSELRKQGLRVRLQEQPFQVLAALLSSPGEVVTREELIHRLWPDGTVVDFDRGLNAAVTRLRQALSDSAETPRYVETLPRRGYRFIAPVERESSVEPAAEISPVPSHKSVRRSLVPQWMVMFGVVILAVGAGLVYAVLRAGKLAFGRQRFALPELIGLAPRLGHDPDASAEQ